MIKIEYLEGRKLLEQVLKGEVPDRIPFSLWRHFPGFDRDPFILSKKEVSFFKEFKPDFLKLNPSGWYWVEDQGVKLRQFKDFTKVEVVEDRPIKKIEDWDKITSADFSSGTKIGDRLVCINLIRRELGKSVPIFETVFSPLTICYKLAGDSLKEFLENSEGFERLRKQVQMITYDLKEYLKRLEKIGVDGVFFATQTATKKIITKEQFIELELEFSKDILNLAGNLSLLRFLHLHGEDIFFEEACSLPFEVVGWHLGSTSPSLEEGAALGSFAISGGLRRENLLNNSFLEIKNEIAETIYKMERRRIIISPDCTIRTYTNPKILKTIARFCKNL